jgi:hypothetical protein
MKVIKFTEDSLSGLDLKTFGFNWYTICGIQETIRCQNVNSVSLAKWLTFSGCQKAVLKLDDFGNFLSLTCEN